MLKSFITNGLRTQVKQLPYSFVSILGMTIGLTAVIVLIIWIAIESSFDKFHMDQDRLYRVGLIFRTPNKILNLAVINHPAGPEYKHQFPAIENSVRFDVNPESVIYNEKTVRLQVFYTDSTFLQMFSFDVVRGDKATCLESQQTIVLTQKAATKVFGTEDPIGKGILISGSIFTVSALVKDPPVNTNLRFECLAPLGFREKQVHVGWDGGLSCYTYLKLVKGSDPVLLEKQIVTYMDSTVNKEYVRSGFSMSPYLQKISDIHLDSSADYDLGEKGSKTNIIMFSGIGLIILLIACFNFINISTALSFRRAKEVSVKKIFGSDRRSMVTFFIIESGIGIIISLLLAFLLAKIILPVASGLLGTNFELSIISVPVWILIFISLFLFCTLCASFYSSFYLSSINPLDLLNAVNTGKRKQLSRNILVTFQYTISTVLIICCLVIYSQMQYIKHRDKGFNSEDLLLIHLTQKTSASSELLKSRFSALPGVLSVSESAGGLPGVGFTTNGYIPEGEQKPVLINAVYVDRNYLNIMRIPLVKGRDFGNPGEESNKAIINQSFSKLLSWKDPVGKSIARNGRTYEIIGEVQDFSTSSLHSKTEPIFISTTNEWGQFENIILKYQKNNLSDLLKKCELTYKESAPGSPFEYEILEDSIAQSYSAEFKLNNLLLVLAVVAILISSLGLFGLATFSTQSRMREISIRKINGATISDVYFRFNFDLLMWLLISSVLAIPVGLYAMNQWLKIFIDKTPISFLLLTASCLITLTVGLLTVSWAAGKAARTNPAEALRKN